MEYRINLNDFVKVKLTRLGREIYYHQFDNLNSIGMKSVGKTIIEPRYPDVDDDGYTRFQLWNLIEIYGRYIGITKPNVFEPLEVVFDAREVRE